MNQKQKNNKKLKTKTYIHVAQKKSSVIVCGVSSGGETGKDTWKAGMTCEKQVSIKQGMNE